MHSILTLLLNELVLMLLTIELVSYAIYIQPLMILLRRRLGLRLLKVSLVLVAAHRTAIHLVMVLLLLLAWETRLPRRQRASVGHIRRVCIRL